MVTVSPILAACQLLVREEFLEERFAAKQWHGHTSSLRLVKGFLFEGSELKGWKLLKVKHSEEGTTKVIRSMWVGACNL